MDSFAVQGRPYVPKPHLLSRSGKAYREPILNCDGVKKFRELIAAAHPSSTLRAQDEDLRHLQMEALINDLRKIAPLKTSPKLQLEKKKRVAQRSSCIESALLRPLYRRSSVGFPFGNLILLIRQAMISRSCPSSPKPAVGRGFPSTCL
jgi:hypothetical protein